MYINLRSEIIDCDYEFAFNTMHDKSIMVVLNIVTGSHYSRSKVIERTKLS